MNLYPRSFLSMIVMGNIMIMLPLLAAIVYVALAAEDMTRHSNDVVRQASRAATIGYRLQEDVNNMELILRQYEVLHDPSLLNEYEATRLDWQRNAEAYAAIPLFAGLAAQIGDMQKAEAAAYEKIGSSAEALPRLKPTLEAFNRNLHSLLGDANRRVEDEHEGFRLQSATLLLRLIAALWAALILSGLLLWFGRRTMAHLWNRFERTVLALGRGQLARPVQLKGPADVQRVGRRLEWLRRRMLALENERTRVMRHASHELKTPLAALHEGASLLKEGIAGPLTPQQAKIAGIMQTNAIRLQELIDGVLRMQQASYARDHLETSVIRLDQVVEQTLATLELAARDRRVRITSSLVPLTVKGSNEALAALVNNLISNAIKFSNDSDMVRIMLAREGNSAVLDVLDEGPGISAEDRERLFEPFYRGSASTGVPGVGLGLAIAHEFALAHHGTLEVVDSERGAHFRASLPLTEQAA